MLMKRSRDSLANRAGMYIYQLEGYRAFIPKPLPPDPPIEMDAEMMAVLSEANLSLGRLDGAAQILPNPDLFVAMYVRKEAVLSSQVEGTQSSLIDLLEFEAKKSPRGLPKDVGETVNYVRAMNYGLERLKELPLSLRLIREIHAELLVGVRGSERMPGEFRNSQNWIGAHGGYLADAFYVPPPVHEMKQALDNLEKFLYNQRSMAPLIKCGVVHSQFETIHPFLDGNGRIGRLLITFLLCQQGILHRPLLYLSYYFKKNREQYYDRLQAVRDNGDWEGWLKFFLQGMVEVSVQATTTAKRITDLQEEHKVLVQAKLRSMSYLRLLEHLYLRPITSVTEIQAYLEITYNGANRLVNELVKLGLLTEMTKAQRYRLFCYESYLKLLREGTEFEANRGQANGGKAIRERPADLMTLSGSTTFSTRTDLAQMDQRLELFEQYRDRIEFSEKAKLALDYFARGEYVEAIECYDRAIELEPGDAGAHNNKGVALVRLGQYEEAIKCFDRAIELKSSYSLAYYNKGVALRNLGRHQETIGVLNKAIELEPNYANAYYNRARSYAQLGKRDEAMVDLRRAIELNQAIRGPARTGEGFAMMRDDAEFKKLVG